MNVLLAYPRFPETFWSYSHALRFVRKKAVCPPLGLLTVAALLPNAWGKRLVDLNVQGLSDADLLWADYVFISAMSVQRDSANELLQACKRAGKKVVMGGPLFTAEGPVFPEADHYVMNEAELTLAPFVADVERGCPQRIYRTEKLADLTQSPTPMWELLDQEQYTSLSLQYSRGCPFDCDFCSVTAMLGRKPRIKSTDQVIAELDAIRACGWAGTVFVVDDNFIGKRAVVRNELLPAIASWQTANGPMPLYTQVSIDLADDPVLVERMVAAGFDSVFIGIETTDADSLAECGKRQNRARDLAANVRLLQHAGLEVQAGFIVGFDHDTVETFQKQIDFIQCTGIVTAMVGLLQAIGGTRLYDRMLRENRLTNQWTGDNVASSTNIIPRMGLERLYSGYARLLKGIYSPPAYYKRVRTFLREYQLPRVRTPIDRQKISALARSIVRLGIIGRERWQYWKLMTWALFRRPTLLPIAVRLAICGHHYMRVCRLA